MEYQEKQQEIDKNTLSEANKIKNKKNKSNNNNNNSNNINNTDDKNINTTSNNKRW